jgi:transketolase
VIGGLGSTIATLLAKGKPTPTEFVAVNDSFGESGTPDQLLAKYGLETVNVYQAAKKVLNRK